jgi:hypothetical protein
VPTYEQRVDKEYAVPTTGGNVQIDLRQLELERAGKVCHLRAIYLRHTLVITQAAGAPALDDVDWPRLVALAQLFRHNTKLLSNLPGDAQQALAACRNGGVPVLPDQGSLAVSPGGATTTVTWDMVYLFRDSHRYGRSDRVWPCAAFADEGKIKLTYANPATCWGALFSLGAASTVQCIAKIELRDKPVFGYDSIEETVDSNRTTTDVIDFDPGIYAWLIAAPASFGTGGYDTATTKFTSFDGSPKLPHKFPLAEGVAEYNRRYLFDKPMFASDPRNFVTNGRKNTQEVLVIDQDWKLAATVGAALTTAHRYVIERIVDRDETEEARALKRLGMTGTFHSEAKTADGRAIAPHRKRLVPVEIQPGSATDPMVKATGK